MQGLASDDLAPSETNNRRSMTVRHKLLEMSPGYPKGLRCLLNRKGLNGSILGSLHPAHLSHQRCVSLRPRPVEQSRNDYESRCMGKQDRGFPGPRYPPVFTMGVRDLRCLAGEELCGCHRMVWLNCQT
jgi:hypothetical protein